MALYNPYLYGFNQQPSYPSYNGMQPSYNNPNQPNFNMNQQQPTQLHTFAYVNGIEGAKAFQVQPNQMIPLFESETPFVFLKQSNSMGQSNLKCYELVERDEDYFKNYGKPSVNVAHQEYVLKTDFDALKEKMNELSTQLENIVKTKGASE